MLTTDAMTVIRGDVVWEASFPALAAIAYNLPISIEWEDAGMERIPRARSPRGLHKYHSPAPGH